MQVKISDNWGHYLAGFQDSKKDIYFTEEYVHLYESMEEKACCFICQDGEKVFLLPFLVRDFIFSGKVWKDFETAYGYGGPVCNSEDESFIIQAWSAFKSYCQSCGYVAGFLRFHPLLQNQKGFDSIGQLLPERRTVAIDLDQSMDEVWMNEIHSKNRNMIRKAEKAGLRFEADYQFQSIDRFIELYNSTMDKLSAEDFYYFGENYYKHLISGIPDSFLGCVYYGDMVISSAIFMFSGPYGHYHLSGSDLNHLTLSPNNFMLWEAAKELQRKGVKRFHLGGGTNSEETNSLFLFKHRFSKNTYQFYIGKMVFNQEAYEAICADWEQRNPDKVEHYRHHLLKYKY